MKRPLTFAVGLGLAAAACGDAPTDRTDDAGVDSDQNDTVEADSDTLPDVADSDAATDGPTDSAGDATADADVCSGRQVQVDGATVCVTSACELRPGVAEPVTAEFPNGWRVDAAGTTGAVSLTNPDGDVVLDIPGACAEADRPALRSFSGEPYAEFSLGAFRIELESARARTAWTVPIGGAPAISAPDASSLTIRHEMLDGTAVIVSLRADGDGVLVEAASDDDDARRGVELSWLCSPDADVFGLGTQVTGMSLRGRTFPLWTQEQGIGKPENNPGFPLQNVPEAAYAPMGVWHTTDGLSALIATDVYSELAVCDSDVAADRFVLRSFPGLTGMLVLPGATPAARISALTARTGRPPVPPDWVLGPWNDAVGGPDRLAEVTEVLRSNDIPSSAIWSEDWIGGEQGPQGFRLSYAWEWDPDQYPDLPGLVDDLHADGFAFLGYFNTFVPQPTRMYAEGTEGGFLVRKPNGTVYDVVDPAFRTAALVDLTNPEARAWMAGYIARAATEIGMDGFMADFTEWLPTDALLADGRDGWQYHNVWPLDFFDLVADTLAEAHTGLADEPANNWSFFARSGWASVNGGSSGAAVTMWGGDQNTDWDADDGLPTVVPMAVHAGLAGVGIFATDVAGYTSVSNPNTTKELFYRWSTLGVFHGILRTHHGSDECGNWSFDRDAETLAHWTRWTRVRSMLFPTLSALAGEAATTGLPMMRHPWLVEPELRQLWRTASPQFFVGNDLLVAPVQVQGATSREVALPDGWWWPLFGDAPVSDAASPGPWSGSVDIPVTEIGVFVRPGTAIWLLPEPVESFYPLTRAAGVTTLAGLGGDRLAAIYPDATGSASGSHLSTTVEVSGLLPGADLADATLGGAPLPACPGSGDEPCWDNATRRIRVTGTAQIDVATARLEIIAEAGSTLWVGLAGEAWGELATVPPTPDLAAVVAPPCEE